MADSFFLRLVLLVSVITTTSLSLIAATEPLPPIFQPSSPPPSPPSKPPPPPFQPVTPPSQLSAPQTPPPQPALADIQENQLNKIIDALIGAGDFVGWANILSSANPSSLPLTATLFIPSNDAISRLPPASAAGINFNPFLIPYHIVPQRLTFSDLQQFNTHTRLPTLLPSKYIVITNNSPSNFTVDNSQITHPDIFVNPTFSLHGIKNVLDYSIYGDNSLISPPRENNKPPRHKSSPLTPKGSDLDFPGETTVDLRSGAACLCTELFLIFTVVCTVFASSIL